MINKRLLTYGGGTANILSYSVSPSSISGTSSSTLTHTVTGDVGATFTINSTGATVHTIGSGGTFSTTTSQGARGTGSGAITRTYTATNTLDPTNLFTDTVYQGAGPAAVYPTFSPSLSVSPNTTTYSNGSSHVLTSTASWTVTAAGNSRPVFQASGINAAQVLSYSATFAKNGTVQYTASNRSGYQGWGSSSLPVGTVIAVTITTTTTDDGMNPGDQYAVTGVTHQYAVTGHSSFVTKSWSLS